jgi:hypothetical protein
MSDFSSISVARDFALLPKTALDESYFQSKDLPDDPVTGCIDGEIQDTGLFVRTDGGHRLWSPSLDGWIHLIGHRTGIELIARFECGRVVEVRAGHRIVIDDMSPLPGAYHSPNLWRPLDT